MKGLVTYIKENREKLPTRLFWMDMPAQHFATPLVGQSTIAGYVLGGLADGGPEGRCRRVGGEAEARCKLRQAGARWGHATGRCRGTRGCGCKGSKNKSRTPCPMRLCSSLYYCTRPCHASA